jgi:hypothetical protein
MRQTCMATSVLTKVGEYTPNGGEGPGDA